MRFANAADFDQNAIDAFAMQPEKELVYSNRDPCAFKFDRACTIIISDSFNQVHCIHSATKLARRMFVCLLAMSL